MLNRILFWAILPVFLACLLVCVLVLLSGLADEYLEG